jgi:hypothetical protein
MSSHQVELIDETGTVTAQELTQVAAALQKQITDNLAPAWGTNATVSVGNGNGKPGGALGVHLDDKGQPYAVIEPGQDWSITASHELLEMLVGGDDGDETS